MNTTNSNTNTATSRKRQRRPRPPVPSSVPSSAPAQDRRGWVLAGNPDHLPSVPLPVPGEMVALIRKVRVRRAYTPKDARKGSRTMEITVPADIVRFMALEEGMELLVSLYADGRVMLTRAGMFVGGEETRDL